jgi:cytochrome P450
MMRASPFEPPRELKRLQERHAACPLRCLDSRVGWLILRHALGKKVLRDPRFSVRPHVPVGDPATKITVRAIEAMPETTGSLLRLEPPEHTHLRRILAPHFTIQAVEAQTSVIEQIVERRLNAISCAEPPVDLVQEFAAPVSALTLCAFLGVPESERTGFERPTAVLAEHVPSSAEEKLEALRDFSAYCRMVIERKRANPGSDVISDLVVRGDFSDDALAGAAIDLFAAGHATTSAMLAFSTFFLLSDGTRADAFRASAARGNRPIDELLRYLTILPNGAAATFGRIAAVDVEVDGIVIQAGQEVTVSLAATNRDPQRFADPDKFDPTRDATGHFAFGHGRHTCLGQHLARKEMQIGLTRLFNRFPDLRLAVPADRVPLHAGSDYRVRELPVAW